MEVNAWDETFLEGAHGTCKACLYEDELDADALCATCNPLSAETRTALIALLNADDTKKIMEAIGVSENS